MSRLETLCTLQVGDARYFTRNMELTIITDVYRINTRNHERLDSAVRDRNKSKPVGDTRG